MEEPPADNSLCDTCKSLDLQIEDFFPEDSECGPHDAKPIRWAELGTWRECSRKTSCPLCRITVNSTYGYGINEDLKDSTKLVLSLRRELSFREVGSKQWKTPVNLLVVARSPVRGAQWLLKTCLVPEVHEARAAGATTSQFFARKALPKAQKCSLIRDWLNTCINIHGSACGRRARFDTDSSDIRSLLLVDVQNQCLVNAPPDCEYIALSYVWGKRAFFKTTLQNFKELQVVGSLIHFQDVIPKTVRDAMDMVRLVSERYLWVDSLCIVQDDPSQKHDMIASMDAIYGRALLTVIASTSEDAHGGLFLEDFGATQIYERIAEGLTLVGVNVHTSPWMQDNWSHERRAWTYQELLLSKRQVLFVNGIIFFACSQTRAMWREDLAAEQCEEFRGGQDLLGFRTIKRLFPSLTPENAMKTFARAVGQYSERELTYPGDILHAFSGISKILEREMKTKVYYGLPVSSFDVALLWANWFPSQYFTRRFGFPSWSWAGWCGRISMTHDLSPEISNSKVHKWIQWYCFSEAREEIIPLDTLEPGPTRTRAKIELPGALKAYLTEPIQTVPSPTANLPHEPGILRFFTVSAVFEIATYYLDWNHGPVMCTVLLDRFGKPAGNLSGKNPENMQPLIGIREVLVLSEQVPDEWPKPSDFADIPLGHVFNNKDRVIRAAPRDNVSKNPEDIAGSPLEKVYNILIIEWEGNLAYRLATGWLYQRALSHSFAPGVQWKEIALG